MKNTANADKPMSATGYWPSRRGLLPAAGLWTRGLIRNVNQSHLELLGRLAGESHLERSRRICDQVTVFGTRKLGHKP